MNEIFRVTSFVERFGIDADGARLARDLEIFVFRFPNPLSGSLGDPDIQRKLGLVSAQDFEHSGVGGIFLTVWNLGICSNDKFRQQIPLAIDVSIGVRYVHRGAALELNNFPMAVFDVRNGGLHFYPLADVQNSISTLRPDSLQIIKPIS